MVAKIGKIFWAFVAAVAVIWVFGMIIQSPATSARFIKDIVDGVFTFIATLVNGS